MSFKAEIVADSKNQFGNRITTFVVTFPRIILAEFNTHRMLSRNSASSRAIPFEKMVKAVEENPFIPIAWMKDHKGMQGTQYILDKTSIQRRVDQWLYARDLAILAAKKLYEPLTEFEQTQDNIAYWEDEESVTKQMCNRLLETFMYHTCIVTGTEWENFFALRAHMDAEIHMQRIAYIMLNEYNKSIPKQLKAGEWHIPYEKQIEALLPPTLPIREGLTLDEGVNEIKVKLSTVMGARTSYTVVGTDQKPMTWDRMVELHDQMKSAFPKHMSPFEHCAPAMSETEYYFQSVRSEYIRILNPEGSLIKNSNTDYGWCGNFRGFKQYRKMIAGENANDNRVIKK